MNNKAILTFKDKNPKRVKYGKWLSECGVLYFNYRLIASYNSKGEMDLYPKTLADCGFEYPTFHTIEKCIKFLNS